ncbi:MAG: NTPase [Nitrospirales bacterium]|nr:MAG: NTPase [Nitrospirales bacterium]
MHTLLSNTLQEKVKDLVPNLGKKLLQAGPIISSALALTPAGPLAALTGQSLDFAKRFFPEEDTLEKTFQKLSEILEREKRRFVIIVDDIDRLSPDEALAIFRVVKSVGRLPNVMYLLVFDRELAEKAIKERYPSEGPHFLEKIIQASVEVPVPLRTDLNHAVLMSIEKICGPLDESKKTRILNSFYDVVAPYINTPRHVVRFQNAISVSWPAIANEISLADFIALETLRLYEPSLFQAIRSNKSKLCGLDSQNNPRAENKFLSFLDDVHENKKDTAKLALQRLFPRMEDINYVEGFLKKWDAERRVCIEKHFDTYFRLSLSSEALSIKRIDEIIEHIDEPDYVHEIFREAALSRRRSGTSMIPILLDELITHASKIEKGKVQPFLNAIFEIHDDIDLDIDEDRGMYAVGDTSRRYHWLIRSLTRDRFTIAERTDLYLAATRNASLGWLVDFVSSAKSDYSERKAPRREEDCLIRQDAIQELVQRAVASIRSAASDNQLLLHRDLLSILYFWRDFLGNDPAEVRMWTDALLDNGEALVILAKAFTGESWSYAQGGFGRLGDNVATRNSTVRIDENTDIIDQEKFRLKLEELQSNGRLQENDQRLVDEFLNTWKNKLEVKDEDIF